MRRVPTPAGTQRCPQCWKFRKMDRFFTADGQPRKWCRTCRKNRALYIKGERASIGKQRRGLVTSGEPLVRVVHTTRSDKLGGIPSSITTANTCPPSCGLYAKGCYAEFHLTAVWWRAAQKDGLEWNAFCDWVRALPEGTLWRHNVAGDLPGNGEKLDHRKLAKLVLANSGRRGFTFTHKSFDSEKSKELISSANIVGFTINLSADGLHEADAKAALGIAPVVVVLSADAPAKLKTPSGRQVVVCPAQTHEGMTCAKCQLCARPKRSAIIGFRAHGQMQNRVSRNLVQLRLKLTPSQEVSDETVAIDSTGTFGTDIGTPAAGHQTPGEV